ncbi:MAG: hypothetical protein CL940_12190 [Deltaproteobacteria bacterium]|nr:hypothetical protein [Deltaproteobacteria bacterium]
MSTKRPMILLAMVAALLTLPSTAWADEGAPTPPSEPAWERLTVTEVPEDALRRFGNTSPPQATAARRSWLRVQGRLKQAHAHLKLGRVSTTEDELAEDRRALNMVVSGNPVVCRARHDGEWASGLLAPSAEVCILNVSIGGEEEPDCMRYRRMGPECRPHISVVKSEVYILRHADRLHLVHLQNDVRELRFPHGGLVGVSDGVFGDMEPMCLFGDSRSAPVGVLSQQGTVLRCRASVIGSEEPGSMSFGYGNLDLFADLELRDLKTHLDARSDGLANLETPESSIENVAGAQSALDRLDSGLAAVRAELDAQLLQVSPELRDRGRALIDERLGATFSKLDAHRAQIAERLTDMEIEDETKAFIAAHVQPLVPELEEAGRVRPKPVRAEIARAELETLLKLKGRRAALTGLVASELPSRSRDGAAAKIDALLAHHDRAVAVRLEVVSHLAVDLEERARINGVAEAATLLLANMTVEEKAPEKVQRLYDGLMDQLEIVSNALAHEEPNPALAKHAEQTLKPLVERIQEQLDDLEPSLPAKARIQVLDRNLATLWREAKASDELWPIVALVSETLPEVTRLITSTDEVATQMQAIRRWTELRQDTLETIQAELRLADDSAKPDTFRAALLALPAAGKKASNASGARLAKLLKTNGFAWTWPKDRPGVKVPPVVHVLDWWRAAKIRPDYDPVVAAWTRCTDAIAADWSGQHTYLKACNKIFRKHGESPVIRGLAADIHKELEGLHEAMSFDDCVALRWKHPRAFFVPTVKGQCQIIKKREKRQREIRKVKAELQEYVTKKNFRYARMLLSKLRKAGAERWEVANASTTIDTAERWEKDRKAQKAAESRAKALMSQMPTIELACQQERKSWRHADNEFVRAVRNGEDALADRYEDRKQRFVQRGCQAKQKMTEVVAIYSSQNRPVAAEALVENGQSCFRSWSCEEELVQK